MWLSLRTTEAMGRWEAVLELGEGGGAKGGRLARFGTLSHQVIKWGLEKMETILL